MFKWSLFCCYILQGQCLSLQWWHNVCTASRRTLSWRWPSGTKFYLCYYTRSSHKWTDVLTSYSCWDNHAGTATPNNTHHQGISCNSKFPSEGIKVTLWSNSRYPFFYTFVHTRSFLVILPNFNLLLTLQRMFFGPLFPRIYCRH